MKTATTLGIGVIGTGIMGADHVETFSVTCVPSFAIVAGDRAIAKFAGREHNLPIWGVIDPGVEAAARATKSSLIPLAIAPSVPIEHGTTIIAFTS